MQNEYVLTHEQLLEYRDELRFLPFCKECAFYGKRYSCPPLVKNVELSFDRAHIVIATCSEPHERDQKKQQIEKELLDRFKNVFTAGGCMRCMVCKREHNLSCDCFLLSAEVLYLDMVRLYRDMVGEEMVFDGCTMIFVAW